MVKVVYLPLEWLRQEAQGAKCLPQLTRAAASRIPRYVLFFQTAKQFRIRNKSQTIMCGTIICVNFIRKASDTILGA